VTCIVCTLFFLFLHETRVVSVHLMHIVELCVDFFINGMEESVAILV
jgi:hypothetical protein